MIFPDQTGDRLQIGAVQKFVSQIKFRQRRQDRRVNLVESFAVDTFCCRIFSFIAGLVPVNCQQMVDILMLIHFFLFRKRLRFLILKSKGKKIERFRILLRFLERFRLWPGWVDGCFNGAFP